MRLVLVVAAWLSLGVATAVSLGSRGGRLDERDWSAILAPRGEWPEPLEELVWREDLFAALEEARAARRPVFVTARCLPCKQCSDFDKSVLEGSPTLSPLLRQFVTVRLTDARDLDLRLFDVANLQDLDLSWWGYLLAPEGTIYAVFGGRDHVSDTTRISVAALENTLRRVLAHHYDARRDSWGVDAPAPALEGEPRSPQSLPGFASWSRNTPAAERAECLHCHQVADVLRQPLVDSGEFDKEAGLHVWPLPENVGLRVDRDHGLLVTAVEPESAAARAGLRAGDELGAAAGRRLFGQADLRAALHANADPAGSIALVWLREGEALSGTLELEDGWRATELAWRMSASQGNVGAAPGIPWLHAGSRAGLAPGAMSMRPWFGQHAAKSPAYRAGLRPSHRIVAVGGESPDVHGRSFLVWFRRRYEPGDRVTLTVEEQGRRREISYELPARSAAAQ